MNLQIIKIGNSKGIRIPQSILKQCQINDEVSVKVENGKIILSPIQKEEYDMIFQNLEHMSDLNIQKMLRKTSYTTLAISLLDSDPDTIERVTRNLSKKAREILMDKMISYKTMNAKELIIEMHRGKMDTILSSI